MLPATKLTVSSLLFVTFLLGQARSDSEGPNASKPDCFSCADNEIYAYFGPNGPLITTPKENGDAPPTCGDKWNEVVGDDLNEENFYCVKLISEDGKVGRGAMKTVDIENHFGWANPPKKPKCKGGLTYNPLKNGFGGSGGTAADENVLKGELCLCSQDRCNGASGLQLSFLLLAGAAAVIKLFWS